PQDTDVLITHCPAYGILDFDDNIHYGSEEILSKLSAVRPKAHLFGHIHVQHGLTTVDGTIFSNGAIMNVDYTNLNSPAVIEI
ncbi:MAG: serine/threonine protein phosphatase, partial [Muribaculaceae bacterium]|nr:serine/threonine protein phosphatase [Muribaculaceae bacterium]